MKYAVVDASYILSFLLPDENNPKVDVIVEEHARDICTLIAPSILKFEVLNGLSIACKRKRISQVKALKLITQFVELDIQYKDVTEKFILQTALKYGLSAYDAAYLALAKETKLKLFSHDRVLLSFTQT
ncbi:MAG: hypothetical protein UU93_C0023G0002 [Candidatus Amesbacteria bacterium GW2011_GWA2_42_12]|uniref:PIN domain-containing protein n=1 Tax=Candidatus Amesbacteria bacterium GW2011_GWA2_42_12 TaxID=1618356 RepID=A0A0G0Y2R7_9BACT|nr:MAG: hypothetical protein UU93_C0023G0002 [Candidatus Amesbacteria bacterium GW2011_GWA2_42_12]